MSEDDRRTSLSSNSNSNLSNVTVVSPTASQQVQQPQRPKTSGGRVAWKKLTDDDDNDGNKKRDRRTRPRTMDNLDLKGRHYDGNDLNDGSISGIESSISPSNENLTLGNNANRVKRRMKDRMEKVN